MRRTLSWFLSAFVTVSAPIAACGWLYVLAGEHEYRAFWGFSPGALMLYGRPADARYSEPLARMQERAHQMGFRFADPQLIQTDRLFDLWHIRWRQSNYIGVDIESGRMILVDGLWMVQFDDSELDCVMAHELGHVVDIQTNRIGHPAFEHMLCLTPQQFADAFGRLVCGYEPYQAVMRRHIRQRPLTVSLCSGTTPVP